MATLTEVPNEPVDHDVAYFEAKIAASGLPRTDPANQKYVKIIEQLKQSQRQILMEAGKK